MSVDEKSCEYVRHVSKRQEMLMRTDGRLGPAMGVMHEGNVRPSSLRKRSFQHDGLLITGTLAVKETVGTQLQREQGTLARSNRE